jgi:hypothetical protein
MLGAALATTFYLLEAVVWVNLAKGIVGSPDHVVTEMHVALGAKHESFGD